MDCALNTVPHEAELQLRLEEHAVTQEAIEAELTNAEAAWQAAHEAMTAEHSEKKWDICSQLEFATEAASPHDLEAQLEVEQINIALNVLDTSAAAELTTAEICWAKQQAALNIKLAQNNADHLPALKALNKKQSMQQMQHAELQSELTANAAEQQTLGEVLRQYLQQQEVRALMQYLQHQPAAECESEFLLKALEFYSQLQQRADKLAKLGIVAQSTTPAEGLNLRLVEASAEADVYLWVRRIEAANKEQNKSLAALAASSNATKGAEGADMMTDSVCRLAELEGELGSLLQGTEHTENGKIGYAHASLAAVEQVLDVIMSRQKDNSGSVPEIEQVAAAMQLSLSPFGSPGSDHQTPSKRSSPARQDDVREQSIQTAFRMVQLATAELRCVMVTELGTVHLRAQAAEEQLALTASKLLGTQTEEVVVRNVMTLVRNVWQARVHASTQSHMNTWFDNYQKAQQGPYLKELEAAEMRVALLSMIRLEEDLQYHCTAALLDRWCSNVQEAGVVLQIPLTGIELDFERESNVSAHGASLTLSTVGVDNASTRWFTDDDSASTDGEPPPSLGAFTDDDNASTDGEPPPELGAFTDDDNASMDY